MKNKKRISVILVAAMALLGACSGQDTPALPSSVSGSGVPESSASEPGLDEPAEEPADGDNTPEAVAPYSDIRYFEGYSQEVYEEGTYRPEDIPTFTFNRDTILQGSETVQAQILEDAKNPGLGVRALHDRGITGTGITVAIIDQNLLLNHPEFAGKITAYYDTGCEVDADVGSMHGPAVTSLLVGKTIGVAPDAKVYYAATPSWTGDSAYYAKALRWITGENRKLPEGEKIRVVSVSAAPSGEGEYGSGFTTNLEMWDEAVAEAREEGILVLDCSGFLAPAFYDPANPDDPSLCTGGSPKKAISIPASQIGVPASYRTVAEEYMEGTPSYQYFGQGGLSLGIPYAAGVLALGWQGNPSLGNEEMVELLFVTCATAQDGGNIINPPAFVDAVRATVQP